MIDRPEELASIMNLLLPLDNQLPTGKQFLEEYFSKGDLKSREKLEDVLRGRVSYLRSMESSIVKLFEGKVQAPLKKMPTVPLEMSKLQAKVYIQAYNDDIGAGMSEEEKQKLIQKEVNKESEEPVDEDEEKKTKKRKRACMTTRDRLLCLSSLMRLTGLRDLIVENGLNKRRNPRWGKMVR
jgi:hypothetical protein